MPFFISLREHHSFSRQQPRRRNAAILNERDEPSNFEKPPAEVFSLRIEMAFIY